MARKTISARLPAYTIEQIERLSQAYGLTKTQLLILAIDRFERAAQRAPGQASEDPPAELVLK